MLTYEDQPTIKNAIMKRLGKEPGVQIADIVVKDMKDHIQVGVWLILVDIADEYTIPDVRSWFDLPASFYLRQLHNEIDEIAESVKTAKRNIGAGRLLWTPTEGFKRQYLPGTGLRGRWKSSDKVSEAA